MRIAHPSYRSLISVARRTSAHQYLCFTPPSISNLSKPVFLLPLPCSSLQQRRVVSTSMASDDVSTLSADEDKYGFSRPEMYQSNLAGTVDAYDRHVFLCHKNPEAWASRVEDSESDPLPKLLSSALKARKNDITLKTRLTICEGREGTEFSDGDVLIFPEMVKYRSLKDSDVDSFVEDVLVNGLTWTSRVQEVLTGSFVFVCSHGNRDKRCGVCGPVLIEKFKEEIKSRGLSYQVVVNACSHIGGHKYAGNLIIYSPGLDGKVTGHWYGYVTPEDVPELLDQHIAKGEIIERLWRGQMGVSAEEGEKANDQKLPNGVDKIKEKESETQDTKETFAGCCQGANGGVTCCRDGSLEQSDKSEEKKVEACSKAGSGCKLSSWFRKLDQADVFTAAAVVSAVATVVVAYGFFKRSN
ncbi:altered inheritance of mitochondria protein 32 [Humulus lupulus]|uniref:altered inheritance of mitochondria protein 32 n=1 Tax=Humulus lupulus TaxID=3486 RepID=UPI002B413606|nr:altered inheritance of mitochondria protein 32 [Humulus lupulus]